MEEPIICKKCKRFMELKTSCGSSGWFRDYLHFQCPECGSFASWKLKKLENEIVLNGGRINPQEVLK